MLSKTRQTLIRTVFGSNLAGDGMLVRLRSTSIALLGLVTAIGLGLVAFISQLGWPGIVNSPIPSGPAEAGSIHSAIALTRERAIAPSRSPRPARVPRLSTAAPPRIDAVAAPVATDPGLGGSRQIGAGTEAQPPKAAAQPQPVAAGPVSVPTVVPVRASPVPVTPPAPVSAVVEIPQSSPVTPPESKPVTSTVGPPGRPSTSGVDGGEEGKPEAPSDEKPKCDEAEKGGDHPSPLPPSGDSGGKPESPEPQPPVGVAPPPTPPLRVAPEGTVHELGMEAWDAGRSDERHH